MSTTPQSQSLSDPAFTSSGKPFIFTNRKGKGTGRFSDELFNSQLSDSVTQSLEGTPKLQRGSRKRPSVMKYPIDIGTAQIPHAMQFKIFWRWEAKDLRESIESSKLESKKRIGDMNTLSGLIDGGNLTPEMLARSPLNNEAASALHDIVSRDPSYIKLVDPSSNDTISTLLQNNPGKAREILEQTILAEQSRLSSIEAELTNGVGRIGLDEQERLLVQNRLSENIESTNVTQGLINTSAASLASGVLAAGVGLITGGVKGALTTGGIAAGGVFLAGGAAVAAGQIAKAFNTEAVYDQMVSIYLPFCTKVNNEDAFQYEDSSQAKAGAVFDALGGEIVPTATQGLEAGAQILGNKFASGAVQAMRGAVINPRLEKLFKQKDFRNFSFVWEFYPRNKIEVDTIRDIIETFRYHAHPATSENSGSEESNQTQIILRTPAEFEIRFLSSDPNVNNVGFTENEYLPKIGRCSLNSISIDYTPNSIFSTFKDNSPTAITMTLSFSEMGQLTRETVDKGF